LVDELDVLEASVLVVVYLPLLAVQQHQDLSEMMVFVLVFVLMGFSLLVVV
jgi:hypothetical protein